MLLMHSEDYHIVPDGHRCEVCNEPAVAVEVDGCSSGFAANSGVPILLSMPPAKNSESEGSRVGILRAISTPLGFFVLSLLSVEATIALVLTVSKLSEEHVWEGFFVAAGLFVLVFLVVTGLVIRLPKNLLFGKEELSNPALEPSALRKM